MKQKRNAPMLGFGASSLLAAFAVLCLTVLAMLSITTVQADRRQAESTYQAVTAYYTADRQAQTIFARLKLGETVEGVKENEGIYRFGCPISENQVLEVALKRSDDWEIIRWQTVTATEYEEETLPVWEGR